MSGYYSTDDLFRWTRELKTYRAECPIGETCDNWMSRPMVGQHNAAEALRVHLEQDHSCSCVEGWVILNPDWPLGDGPYRRRCPEGCHTEADRP